MQFKAAQNAEIRKSAGAKAPAAPVSAVPEV